MISFLGVLPTGAGEAPQSRSDPASLKANVVRVVARNGTGFGFIVAVGDRKLIIATAEHTLDGDDLEPRVCFVGQQAPCQSGSVVYVDDPAPGKPDLDLALIETAYPDGLAWRADAMAPVVTAGEAAWFIGRDTEWYIPVRPGQIVGRGDTGAVVYRSLPVAQGVSGAPIVTTSGMVAMHANSDGGDGDARGVAIDEIRTRVAERSGWRWLLVARRRCESGEAHRAVLSGRTVVVHFDWTRPANALDAIAELHCVHARTIPSPVWTASAWGAGGIMYRSGDLRTARALQAVLTPQGRLDPRLGDPVGDAEVWIR